MTPSRPPALSCTLRRLPLPLQWTLILGVSALLVAVLEGVHLPAALLLGPMLAAIAAAGMETRARVGGRIFSAAQGVVGCMMAQSVPLSFVSMVARDWPLFLAGVVSAMALATLLGWVLTRWQVLPGTTAVWGSSPGAATAMVLMAEAYGADMRLVAFMQYLRVVCVAICASLVATLFADGSGPGAQAIVWFPAVSWTGLAATLVVAVAGGLLARRLRIPAGGLLVPFAVGAVLQAAGAMTLTLPPWLLAVSYAFVGWCIGLRFSREVILHAAHAFPRVLASTLLLIAACGGFAALLVRLAGLDPLTAYLATSPGGADSVAIIAASSRVDLPFVMSMQVVRLVLVVITGPALARLVAGHLRRR